MATRQKQPISRVIGTHQLFGWEGRVPVATVGQTQSIELSPEATASTVIILADKQDLPWLTGKDMEHLRQKIKTLFVMHSTRHKEQRVINL